MAGVRTRVRPLAATAAFALPLMSGCTENTNRRMEFDDLQGQFADGSCGSLSVANDKLVLDGKHSRFDLLNVDGDDYIVASPTVRFRGDGDECKVVFVDEHEYIPVFKDAEGVSIDIQSANRVQISRFYKTGT